MIYLKYLGSEPILNTMFGEFKKAEVKQVFDMSHLNHAQTLAQSLPGTWELVNKQTSVGKTTKEKNMLDKGCGRFDEKLKDKGGNKDECKGQ